MKKLMFLAGFAALSLVACNKTENASSLIQDGNATSTEAGATENANQETAGATAQNGFPKIAFDKEVHDFGDLKKGSKGEVEFEIKTKVM